LKGRAGLFDEELPGYINKKKKGISKMAGPVQGAIKSKSGGRSLYKNGIGCLHSDKTGKGDQNLLRKTRIKKSIFRS
jgi:hypothetical protein